jgi:hypothetical protein
LTIPKFHPWLEQSLDRATFIHRTVALSHLFKRKREMKDFSGIYFACPHQIDQLGQALPHRSGPTVEVHVLEEQFLGVQFDAVRDADIAHVPPGRVEWMACIIDSCVPTHSSTESALDAFGQVHDGGNSFVPALGYDVSRAIFTCERLALRMPAYRDKLRRLKALLGK